MSVEPVKYRIRGLIEPQIKPPAPVLEKAMDPEVPLIREMAEPELQTPLFLNMAFTAIGPPKLSDFIHHPPIDRLNAWWPGFDLFTRQYQSPIKIHPVALGPYVPDSHTLLSTPEFKIIEEFCQMRNKERDNINLVLTAAEDVTLAPPSLNTVDTPIAAAVLCVLFRGSTWVKRQEVKLRKIISRSPVAAYIVFHLGRPGQRETFLKYILPDTRLMLHLCTKRQFFRILSPDLLAQAFEKVPHFRPLAHFVSEDLDEANAWKTLTDYAGGDPLSAAFALGLQPNDERARQWHALVSLHPEAIYWALRVWTVYHPAAQFPYWPHYQAQILKDPRWAYIAATQNLASIHSVVGGADHAARLISLFSNQIYLSNICPYTSRQAEFLMGKKKVKERQIQHRSPIAPPLLIRNDAWRRRKSLDKDAIIVTREVPRVDASTLSALKTGEFWFRLANGRVVKGKPAKLSSTSLVR